MILHFRESTFVGPTTINANSSNGLVELGRVTVTNATAATDDLAQIAPNLSIFGGVVTITAPTALVKAVPEPTSLALVGLVGSALAFRRRRQS